jgi:hypothetical protein
MINEAIENKQYCSAPFLRHLSSVWQSMEHWTPIHVKSCLSSMFPYPKILFRSALNWTCHLYTPVDSCFLPEILV